MRCRGGIAGGARLVVRLAAIAAVLLPGLAVAQAPPSRTERAATEIVSTDALAPYLAIVAQEVAATYGLPPAAIRTGTAEAMFASFCAGPGAANPDMLALDRRMGRSQLELCRRNEVDRIVELGFGIDAVTLAGRRGGPFTGVTAMQLYRALAAEVVENDRFVANPFKRWREIDPALPDVEINVVVPEAGSDLRLLLGETVLQDGCRDVPAVRAIFSARDRVARCVALRSDGPVREVATAEARAQALSDAPEGALAVLGFELPARAASTLTVLAIDGIRPTYASIVDDSYPATRRVFVYVKRQNMRDAQGIGVVRGLAEFMAELTSERMVGPDGKLAQLGMVALPAPERVELRRIARSLQIVTR